MDKLHTGCDLIKLNVALSCSFTHLIGYYFTDFYVEPSLIKARVGSFTKLDRNEMIGQVFYSPASATDDRFLFFIFNCQSI